MPNYTKKINLIKPKKSENYDIDEVTNTNMDIIDTELDKKVNKVPGKGLSTNDFTDAFIKLIKQMAESKKGVTFYPHIDENCNLSWTNDGMLENPPTVNIKGGKGDIGQSNSLSIGNVEKGQEASATITGEAPNQVLSLILPKGDKPLITIVDGFWYVDGINTNQKASGEIESIPEEDIDALWNTIIK